MTEQTLANKPKSRMDVVRNFILSPDVKNRFVDMMGPSAIYYLNQVLILVAQSEDLQECTPQSILIAAMRAATLRLSIDPGQGQAWIIPYKKVATYQVGYKGVYELAMRTRQYRFINVFEVFAGEWMEEDRLTGMLYPRGQRTSPQTVIGYCLYFELTSGFKKTFYMTVPEIENHAATYSPGNYNNPKSAWNKNEGRERPKMMKKTVLKNGLMQYGVFDMSDREALSALEEDQGWIGTDLAPARDLQDGFEPAPNQEPELQVHPPVDPPTKPEPVVVPSSQGQPINVNAINHGLTLEAAGAFVLENGRRIKDLTPSQVGDEITKLTDLRKTRVLGVKEATNLRALNVVLDHLQKGGA